MTTARIVLGFGWNIEEGAVAGRDTVPVVPFGTLPTPDKLDPFASLGIEEVVLRVPAGDRDAVLPVLDEYARSHL